MNFWKVADLWHSLMTDILGHERYAAGGCDVGALVCGQLGHKYAGELYGIHAQVVALEKRFAVHLAAHVLAPSTLAYGLSDSPAGMLAWILERWVNCTSSPRTTCAPTPPSTG
jgi:microsomal epoxide hydrolase